MVDTLSDTGSYHAGLVAGGRHRLWPRSGAVETPDAVVAEVILVGDRT